MSEYCLKCEFKSPPSLDLIFKFKKVEDELPDAHRESFPIIIDWDGRISVTESQIINVKYWSIESDLDAIKVLAWAEWPKVTQEMKDELRVD